MSLDLDRPWAELPWVVIDFETTGPKPETAEPVEVSFVRFEQGRITDRFTTLCRPSGPIPAAASAIHGITDEMVAAYHPVHAYAAELLRVGAGALPVAYQERYDRTILHRYIEGTECPAFHFERWVCPLTIVRDRERITSGKGWYRLENVCRRWGVPFESAHRAEGDAVATGMLLWRLFEMGHIKPVSAARLLAHVSRRQAAHEEERTW